MLAVLTVCTYWAYESAQLYVYRQGVAGSLKYDLLFNTAALAIPVAALLGVFFGLAEHNKTHDKIINGKIERHSELMFVQHWTHAVGTVILIITGIGLGTLFIPRMFHPVESIGFALNMHFIGILFFFFGVCYWVTQGILTGEIMEHSMPRKGDIWIMLGHYRAMLFGGEAPPEEKYLAAERIVFPGWIIGVGGIALTGIIKTAAHVWSLPGVLMQLTTFFHGVFAILMVLLLVGHVTAAALIPAGWPMIRSMVTGYCTVEYARHSHALWYDEILSLQSEENFESTVQGEELPSASTPMSV